MFAEMEVVAGVDAVATVAGERLNEEMLEEDEQVYVEEHASPSGVQQDDDIDHEQEDAPNASDRPLPAAWRLCPDIPYTYVSQEVADSRLLQRAKEEVQATHDRLCREYNGEPILCVCPANSSLRANACLESVCCRTWSRPWLSSWGKLRTGP